jgi:predicted dinucleotide-binding enzyme
MKIAILGAGNVGTALARRLSAAGHEIMLGFGRDSEAVATAAAATGAVHGTPEELAAFGDVIAIAVPWGAVSDALSALGSVSGKVVWDCTNPLAPDLSGLLVGGETSGGEEIARLLPSAHVVKGVPPFAELMHAEDPSIGGEAPGLFVAGDDAEAKAVVASLLAQLPATVIDAGPMMAARFIEPAMLLVVRLAYLQGMGPRIALAVQTEADTG